METKVCSICNEELSTNVFYASKRSKDRLQGRCKECCKKYSKLYAESNKEILIQKAKIYKEYHKEHITEYRKNHKEVIASNYKRYSKNHKEQINKNSRKYRINHPGCDIIKKQKRNAQKLKLPHTLTTEQWNEIKLYFNNSCAYCGKELPLAQEHFLALTKGGEYTNNNIICACQSCNSSKGDKDFFIWYPKHKSYNKKRETKILKFLNYKNKIQQLAFII